MDEAERIAQEAREREIARQMLEVREFRRSPWWAIEKGYVFTENEHAKPGEDPRQQFPNREYLHAILEIVARSPVGILMKSRQVMMSWLFCWWLLHGAITIDGGVFVAQGKREEDVSAKGTKALMGRIRFMRRNLPPHLMPVVTTEAKTSEVYANNSTILAIPQGEDVIRGLTCTRVFMDEIAFHPEGEASWTAALPTIRGGGQLWGVTTPNGREFCYGQADPRLPWDQWPKWPSVMEGIYGYQNTRGTQLLAVHYLADETKRTKEYQEEARRGYTNVNMYRRENELDFTLQPGEPVYPEFDDLTHGLDTYVVNPNAPVFLGWDFGYNGQAVSFFQHDRTGALIWFDQIFYKRVPLQQVCHEVNRRLLSRLGYSKATEAIAELPLKDLEGNEIPGARVAKVANPGNIADVLHFGDPSANQHNTKGESDRLTLATYGFMLRTKPTQGRKMDLVEQFRALLISRSDGTPGMRIVRGPGIEMRYVLEGFKGGYHYPERKEGRADKQLPEKDGFYDHIFDSAQYAIDHIRPTRAAMVDEGLEADWWKDAAWKDNPFLDGYTDGIEVA